ncbi:MAG TPA: MBL fold metallo-hydrolase [Bacillota bacterium]|nr:MBL fold metallo-hydrolase [Bacillota bacterium]
MNIKFFGAVISVTGSCYLVTTDKYKFLLDCGQFQGSESLEKLNFEQFGFQPTKIDFMILSHAHIDHSGRIPLLTKRGFHGKIYCTEATADLADLMLRDSGGIQEQEAEWANKKALRKGEALVKPLYTVDDAVASLKYFNPVSYDQMIEINPEVTLRFRDAGHILGSTIVELWVKEGGKSSKLVFSGDLGQKNKPILKDPAIIEEADYLIMETTYGDRLHEPIKNSLEQFKQIILKTIKRGGTVVIPSFAVGRTQDLIYELNLFYEQDPKFKQVMENIMVYVDSPMATSATEIFRRNADVFDAETKALILKGNQPLEFKNLKFTKSSEESKKLNDIVEPKIIISSSGMCTAGRIKHHLKHNLWNPKTSVIFVGYQAPGTLGRSIVSGAKDVHIFGEKIHVGAEIYSFDNFSGHTDREGLLQWLEGFKKLPRETFLVHGEAGAKQSFADFVKQKLGYDCIVVSEVSEYDLNTDVRVELAQPEKKVSDQGRISVISTKLSGVYHGLDTILKQTQLNGKEEISIDQIDEVAKILSEMEEATNRLKSLVEKKE